MSGQGSGLDPLAEQFERLVELPAAARDAALADPALDPALRRELAALLAAADLDAGEDRIARAIERGAARLTPGVPSGARLGPWRVEREIGSGGMGTVLLAERAEGAFRQQAALKLLRGFPTADGARRLRQERQILATLDHPCIARLLDGGETREGQPWLAMEYVEGLPLARWLAETRPGLAQRHALADALLDAVAHAHARLVIHRDIKPGNVLVRADGTPKLLDFGVARLVEVGADASPESTRVFSAGYASPEQRAGGQVTVATDVYSLGVLLRELFADAPSDAELRGIIAKATAEAPAERYPTADALRDDLDRLRRGLPVRAAPDTPWYRARKFIARHRAAALFGVAAVLATLAFVAGLGRALDEARSAQAAAEAARIEAESQRRVAERVSDFMVDVFGNANTARTGGREVTARELLERAAASLREDRALDATTRARLSERLATAYIELDAAAEAEGLLEDALAQRSSLPPALAARLDQTHARILGRTGRLDEALAANQRAREALAGADPDPAFAVRLVQQAMWIANRQGRFERTVALADEALALARDVAQPGAREVALVLNSRAMAELELGRTDAGIASYRAALASLPAGDASLERVEFSLNLAGAVLNAEQARAPDTVAIGEAIGLLDALEPLVRRIAARDNRHRLSRLLRVRADLLTLAGRPEAALPQFAEALEVDASSMPPGRLAGSIRAARTRAWLALGRHDEVLADIAAVADPLPAASTELDDNYAELYAARAAVHCARGRVVEARADAAAVRLIASAYAPATAVHRALEFRLARLASGCVPPLGG